MGFELFEPLSDKIGLGNDKKFEGESVMEISRIVQILADKFYQDWKNYSLVYNS